MKIETLKDRITKTNEKINKINGTLERHQKQLNKKADILTQQGIDLNNYDKYELRQTDTYWDICDYEGKLEDIESNNKKLREANNTLTTLQEQLKNQIAADAENENIIPEVLNIFLENWKQKCFKYYIDLANEFIKVKNAKYEITREELENLTRQKYDYKIREYINIQRYSEDEINSILDNPNSIPLYQLDNVKTEIKHRHIKEFRDRHFISDMIIVDKIINYDTIDESVLNKILDNDVKEKRDTFIKRIKEVIGEIKDLSGLQIGNNGDLNGIAKGVKCNAKVETITAGGYNIQCYHFRVLVNTIK